MTVTVTRNSAPSAPTPPTPAEPRSSLFAGCAARKALDRQPAAYTDAIAWYSAHLATLNDVVVPVAKRQLPDDVALVGAHRIQVHLLEHEVRSLHGRLAGDGAMAHLNVDQAAERVRRAHDTQRVLQDRLVDALVDALGENGWASVVERYTRRLRHAPTRPHPHVPHAGPVGHLVVRLSGLSDRVLDVLDSRPLHPLSSDMTCAATQATAGDKAATPTAEP